MGDVNVDNGRTNVELSYSPILKRRRKYSFLASPNERNNQRLFPCIKNMENLFHTELISSCSSNKETHHWQKPRKYWKIERGKKQNQWQQNQMHSTANTNRLPEEAKPGHYEQIWDSSSIWPDALTFKITSHFPKQMSYILQKEWCDQMLPPIQEPQCKLFT